MCGLCDAYSENEPDRWWDYGDYTGGACPNCGRERLMACEQVIDTNISVERTICEKCAWEPAKGAYCLEAASK